jgi:prepilin-type N-terminal cleavage/methylation domain-containing protein
MAMRRSNERGFNLIEVMIALALLAAVLISIAGLFVIGARYVESGRSSSQALAAGRTILEEMSRWPLGRSYQAFGFDGASTSYAADTRTNGYAAKWQPLLSSMLAGSHATIRLQSLGPGSNPPSMSAARAIRVLVTVSWDEGARHRTLRLGTVKM